MGKYADQIKSTPVSQSVNACQTWSNGQAFKHGFSDAKTACFEIAAEADAEIEQLEKSLDTAIAFLLKPLESVGVSEGLLAQYHEEARQALKGKNHD